MRFGPEKKERLVTATSWMALITASTSPVLMMVPPVAMDAIENGVIAWIGVAFGAIVPNIFMAATVNGEILTIMIKRCRRPGIRRMTGCAIGWKISGSVVGI